MKCAIGFYTQVGKWPCDLGRISSAVLMFSFKDGAMRKKKSILDLSFRGFDSYVNAFFLGVGFDKHEKDLIST